MRPGDRSRRCTALNSPLRPAHRQSLLRGLPYPRADDAAVLCGEPELPEHGPLVGHIHEHRVRRHARELALRPRQDIPCIVAAARVAHSLDELSLLDYATAQTPLRLRE